MWEDQLWEAVTGSPPFLLASRISCLGPRGQPTRCVSRTSGAAAPCLASGRRLAWDPREGVGVVPEPAASLCAGHLAGGVPLGSAGGIPAWF